MAITIMAMSRYSQPRHVDSDGRGHRCIEKREQQMALEDRKHEHDEKAQDIGDPKVGARHSEHIPEEKVAQIYADRSEFEEDDSQREGSVERADRRVVLQAGAVGDHFPAQRHQRAEKKPEWIERKQNRANCQPQQQRMRKAVREQRVPAHVAVRESDQHAAEQRLCA